MEELSDRGRLRKDTERARAFQLLVESEGWKFLVELINGKVEEKTADLFERPKGMSELRGEDYDKGACYSLLWVRDLPAVTIAAFKDEIALQAATEDSGL